jgi:CubicO group peptidase (beta-lactamase class C family)
MFSHATGAQGTRGREVKRTAFLCALVVAACAAPNTSPKPAAGPGGANAAPTTYAISDSPLTRKFIDSLFADFKKPGSPAATVLVAQDGKVFVDAAYGIPAQPGLIPATSSPNFPLLGLSAGFNAAAVIGLEHDGKLNYTDPFPDGSGITIREMLLQYEQSAARKRNLVRLVTRAGGAPYVAQIQQRIFSLIGMRRTIADSVSGEIRSNVDELYQWELGLTANPALHERGLGWRIDNFHALRRESEFGTSDGGRNAFVRYPTKHTAIIILTASPTTDAQAIADRIADRLFAAQSK